MIASRAPESPSDWPVSVHRILRAAHVRQVAVVPDAGLSRILSLCEADRAMNVIRLTPRRKESPCWPAPGWVARGTPS